MKVIVSGSRTFTDQEIVNITIEALGWAITEVVSGGCEGVDHCGEVWAKNKKVDATIFPAKWEIHGRSAGPIRNKQMAQYAEKLIAFWDGKSRGTANMIEEMMILGKEVYVHRI